MPSPGGGGSDSSKKALPFTLPDGLDCIEEEILQNERICFASESAPPATSSKRGFGPTNTSTFTPAVQLVERLLHNHGDNEPTFSGDSLLNDDPPNWCYANNDEIDFITHDDHSKPPDIPVRHGYAPLTGGAKDGAQVEGVESAGRDGGHRLLSESTRLLFLHLDLRLMQLSLHHDDSLPRPIPNLSHMTIIRQ